MMRGQCLERQKMFIDAAQTYQFIIASYPDEYAYRAARLETLQSLGHYPTAVRRWCARPGSDVSGHRWLTYWVSYSRLDRFRACLNRGNTCDRQR
jgi:hypothetical protein